MFPAPSMPIFRVSIARGPNTAPEMRRVPPGIGLNFDACCEHARRSRLLAVFPLRSDAHVQEVRSASVLAETAPKTELDGRATEMFCVGASPRPVDETSALTTLN